MIGQIIASHVPIVQAFQGCDKELLLFIIILWRVGFIRIKNVFKIYQKNLFKKKEYFVWECEFLFLRSNVFFLLTLPFLS